MTLAMWYHLIAAVVFAVLAIALMGIILLQRGKGVGLAGAFGGAGGHTAFGAKTGDALTWGTIVLAVLLLIVAILLNYLFQPITPTTGTTPSAPPGLPADTTGEQQTSWAPGHASPSLDYAGLHIWGADQARRDALSVAAGA
jgi:preprotein translocase subunit SecG